jgi:hypothetical protein
MALLHHVFQRIRWRWWSVVGYRTCYRLLYLHPLLKCSTEAKELSTLDEEMSRFSKSILVDIGVPWTPSIEHLFRRRRWLITASAPLCLRPRITAGASATASIVAIPPSWSVAIDIVVDVAYCYHVSFIRIVIAILTTLFSRVGVKLVFWIDVTIC